MAGLEGVPLISQFMSSSSYDRFHVTIEQPVQAYQPDKLAWLTNV